LVCRIKERTQTVVDENRVLRRIFGPRKKEGNRMMEKMA
jgi:hypothetical protein